MSIKPIFTANRMTRLALMREGDGESFAVFASCEIAISFYSRLRGLFKYHSIAMQQCLLLVGVNKIHTLGLGYSIDVLFIDFDGCILTIEKDVKPNRWAHDAQAYSTLECCSGACEILGVKPGDYIRQID